MQKITGTYLGQGTACPLFQLENDERITLTGRMPGMEPGEKIELEGSWSMYSQCMQGRNFNVVKFRRKIDRVEPEMIREVSTYWPAISGMTG